MPIREGVAGAGFQIALEVGCLPGIGEGDIGDEVPRFELCRVRARCKRLMCTFQSLYALPQLKPFYFVGFPQGSEYTLFVPADE